MSSNRRMTFARLQEIYRRQDPPQWGSLYVPGILATREEAPSMSWAAQNWSEMLQRYVHTLSRIEAPAVRLALFHPQLFELHEQRMLAVERRPHPLSGHPRAVGIDLPQLQGTISVAERLDAVREHRWITQFDPKTRRSHPIPIPYFGDLLLFLSDQSGPYCVNWTVKMFDEDFQRSISVRARVRNPGKDASSALTRHAMEEQYYLDAGIRTVRLQASTIPARLDHNLRNLFLHQCCSQPLDDVIEKEIEDRIRASLRTGEAPQSVLLSVTHRHSCAYQDVRQAFYRLLWQRRVRPELIDEVILVDRPLQPERNDVLTRFASLFAREA